MVDDTTEIRPEVNDTIASMFVPSTSDITGSMISTQTNHGKTVGFQFLPPMNESADSCLIISFITDPQPTGSSVLEVAPGTEREARRRASTSRSSHSPNTRQSMAEQTSEVWRLFTLY